VNASRERLRDLKVALLLGDPLDAQERLEMVAIIEYVSQHLPAVRGRPGTPVRVRAGVVGVLHAKHGIPLKTALFAAAPQADARGRASIERTFRAMRAADEKVEVPEAAVRRALAVLGRA
jgi:hypothetical protein